MPAGFIDSDSNGVALAQCIQQDFGGVFSHANLDAAVAKLGDRLAYNVRVVEKAPTQTQEQVNAVYREWWRVHAPKHLLDNTTNAAILTTYVKSFSAGVFTLASLTEAGNNAEGLQYKTEADIAKASEDRMRRDYQDSLPQNNKPAANRPQKQKELDNAEAIAKVNKQIASTINGYSCNNGNGPGINYSLTEERRAEMKKIDDGFGKTLKERETALKAVKARYFSYPS